MYKSKKQNNNENGITLISLVITIIVLLILAGVTLSLTLGNNGIFNTAKQAGEETNKQTAIETMRVKIMNMQTVTYAEKGRMPTLQELADNLCEDNEIAYVSLSKQELSAINEKINIGESTKIYTKLEKYTYEFEINNNLEIESIDGTKISNTEVKEPEEGESTTGKIPEGYIKPSGTKDITSNGEHDVKAYEKANVNVPIPEGYVQPSGTKTITTKNDKIDVSEFQYADTTGLYTQDEVQSGKDIYWQKFTKTWETDKDHFETELKFVPSYISVRATSKAGVTCSWLSYDSGNTFYTSFLTSGAPTEITTAWALSGKKLTFNSSSPSNWKGVEFDIWTVK